MRDAVKNTALVLLSTVLTLAVLELGIRVWMGDFALTNLRRQKVDLFRSAYPAAHDAELGWIPKPGASGKQNIWHTQVTILDDGVRSNGAPLADFDPHQAPILAVGDSFTFGDQVSDTETWPAQLQALTQRPVINGGVFGYGIDQTYLRTRRLLQSLKPRAVVFSLIGEDIERCQNAVRNAVAKPYFELDSAGQLQLRNVPTPPPPEHDAAPWRWKDALGYSYLVHKVMMKSGLRSQWLQGDWGKIVNAHTQAPAVACRVLQATERLVAEHGVPLYVLLQYKRDDIDDAAVLHAYADLRACLQPSTMLIDLQPELAAARARDADVYSSWFKGHMTAAGNRWVAERIQHALRAPATP